MKSLPLSAALTAARQASRISGRIWPARRGIFGAEHKHAAVPVVLPGGEGRPRRARGPASPRSGPPVRGVGAVGEGHAALDVAVAGFRGVRHDTEGDQMAFIRHTARRRGWRRGRPAGY